ncbi:type II toxin-antitoxin system Phd/YefM family antitoxin [Phyllobacterium sp. LjRoot231]|uniref:type II toxin-antitoxin system Phd/YefM family antitoxin n=1 Tax=Phyllobacterium sp. LjRoot231 TaxID=3342289 RepID=UPI003ECD3AC1
MKTVNLRDAKATFSSLVDEVVKGETVTITRHGKPAAVLVSVETARNIQPLEKSNFGKFLLTYPGGVELERNQTPMRRVKL